MKSASEILREMRIEEKAGRNGEFMTTCPACSHLRKKKRDRCLSVKVDSLGVRWHCHHCGDFSGGKYFNGSADTRTDWRGGHGKARAQSRDRGPIGRFYR